jgi:hypothetical protein
MIKLFAVTALRSARLIAETEKIDLNVPLICKASVPEIVAWRKDSLKTFNNNRPQDYFLGK